MTTVYLVRHGRTALNAEGRYRGHADPPLDDAGVLEAEETSLRLAAIPLRAVAASLLRRAIQTAEIVAMPHGLHVEPDPRLIDIDYGSWTACTQEEAEALDPELHRAFRSDPRQAATPSERVEDVAERTLEALCAVSRRHPDSTVAVVSHDVPIRALLSQLLGFEGERFWTFPLPTASATVLAVTDGQVEVLELPQP
ncbi:MAG: histidine phosphatase family protein [Actinomycetota bacterium]